MIVIDLLSPAHSRIHYWRLRGKGLHALAPARAAISTSDLRLMCPSAYRIVSAGF
jgi:hypothetical protein